jgi:hypothetical protein
MSGRSSGTGTGCGVRSASVKRPDVGSRSGFAIRISMSARAPAAPPAGAHSARSAGASVRGRPRGSASGRCTVASRSTATARAAEPRSTPSTK